MIEITNAFMEKVLTALGEAGKTMNDLAKGSEVGIGAAIEQLKCIKHGPTEKTIASLEQLTGIPKSEWEQSLFEATGRSPVKARTKSVGKRQKQTAAKDIKPKPLFGYVVGKGDDGKWHSKKAYPFDMEGLKKWLIPINESSDFFKEVDESIVGSTLLEAFSKVGMVMVASSKSHPYSKYKVVGEVEDFYLVDALGAKPARLPKSEAELSIVSAQTEEQND